MNAKEAKLKEALEQEIRVAEGAERPFEEGGHFEEADIYRTYRHGLIAALEMVERYLGSEEAPSP